jgi:ketosteroid isomerase-like protein
MKKIYCAGIILLTSIISCKQQDVLTREEVMAVINRFDEGWKNKDARVVDSVLSQQYIYFTQSGYTFDRASLLQTADSSIYLLQTMERQEFTIQLEGNTAVVNTVWKGKGTYHGQEFDDNQRCSITIVKNDGQVKILSEHCTPIK